MPVRLAVAALALACALAVPHLLSNDVWAYAAYGALLADGRDPWGGPWHAGNVAPLHDPLLGAALARWGGSLPRDVYGPPFTAACALIVLATRALGAEAAVFALRLAAALGLLACVAVAGRSRPRLAALLAFHPVVLWSAAEGHNDVFWLLPVLLAERTRGPAARLAALVAAVAVKAVALVPLVWTLARPPRRGRLPAAAVAVAVCIALYAPLLRSIAALGLDPASGPPRISIAHASALAAWAGSPVPLAVGLVLAVLACIAAGRALRRGDLLAGATLLGWAAYPTPEPWYALWLVPVVALTRPSPASAGLLAASFTGAAVYVQDAVAGTALHDPALLGGTMLAVYALPLLVALLQPGPAAPGPNPAPPTPPPLETTAPVPSAGPQTTPAPPVGTPAPGPTAAPTPAPPTPTPVPSPTPNLFGYVVSPPAPGTAGPRIVEIALNDRTLHQGGQLLVRITTSPDVTSVVARTMGREIGIPQSSPGVFSGLQNLPTGIPFFLLNRSYQVSFVASTADGRSATYTLPIRLER